MLCCKPKSSDFSPIESTSKLLQIRAELGRTIPENRSPFIDIEVLPLKISGDVLIAQIDKVDINDSSIFILDSKTSILMKFNQLGDFQGKVGTLGFGPGEYQEITDFSIYRDFLTIYSSPDLALQRFSLTDLSFVDKKKVGLFGTAIAQLSEDEFLFYTNHNPSDISKERNVIYLNLESGKMRAFFPYDPKIANAIIPFSGFLNKQQGCIFFSNPFDNKIYVFDPTSLNFNLAYTSDNLDVFKKNFQGSFDKLISSGILLDRTSGISYLGNTFLKNRDLCVFQYFFNAGEYYGILNFSNGLFLSFSRKSEVDLSFRLLGRPLTLTDNNELVFAVTSETLDYFKMQPAFAESFIAKYFKEQDSANVYLVKTKIDQPKPR